MYENRQYNQPASIEFQGTLIKRGNQSPIIDEEFLKWCINNSSRFASANAMSAALGLSSQCFIKILRTHNIKLVYDPTTPYAPKPYQDKDWLYHQVITLNKNAKQIAEEYGWTPRVLEKWMGVYGLHNRSYSSLKHLSPFQRELVTGIILGDGHIGKRNSLIISHAENQKDYLYWKYENLKDLCYGTPTYYPATTKQIGEQCYNCKGAYRFNTRQIDELGEINKIPVVRIFESLTDLQLAIWFLDDSYRGKYDWELCVASYSPEEREVALQRFAEKGLRARFKKDERYIRFTGNSVRQIDDIILANIPNHLDVVQDKIFAKRR